MFRFSASQISRFCLNRPFLSSSFFAFSIYGGFRTVKALESQPDSSNLGFKEIQNSPAKLPLGFKSTPAETLTTENLPTFEPVNPSSKPHLVILGSGWASVSLLKNLDPDNYIVTVVSPVNYFVFTPLLPSAAVGSVQIDSLIEPVRRLLRKFGHSSDSSAAFYVQAEAIDLDLPTPSDSTCSKRVKCRAADGSEFWITYDKLIIAVGSKSITFGVPGVESNCHFLKNCEDAAGIRSGMMSNFERAALPNTSPEERSRLLTFVVCGGGPTGIEIAAEMNDFIEQDLVKVYPMLKQFVSINIIQSSDHILNTFDEKISAMTKERFVRSGINVIVKSRVTAVGKDVLEYSDCDRKLQKLPFGLCVWTTGVGMQDFTSKVASRISGQAHSRAIIVDEKLRIKGVPSNSNDESQFIWALGDCSTIEQPQLISKLTEIFKAADTDKSGSLSVQEFQKISESLREQHPQLRLVLRKLAKMFQRFDKDGDGSLSVEEFKFMLEEVEKKLKPLPATAQVASQQGEYVASILNTLALSSLMEDEEEDGKIPLEPFRYIHLGSQAYIGSETAAMDFGDGIAFGGFGTFWLWRGAFLSHQVTLRQRVNLAWDWIKGWLFGRDVRQ